MEWKEILLKVKKKKNLVKEVFKVYLLQKLQIMQHVQDLLFHLLTLGIPGSGTTAVMLGALLGFGIQPGPRLYETNPDIFWSVIMSMYIGMVVLLILNLPLIPYIARILAVPRTFLIPMILFFSVTGIYLMSFNNFDIFLMIGIAVVATILRLYDFPMPPLILAFVLGGLMEENLRRSLLISDGSWSFLWDRPLTLCIMCVILLIIGMANL